LAKGKKKQKFEDNIDIVDEEIAKRRGKWNLSSLSWIDYDDVSQIIRIHVYEKWAQYDQSKSLRPWLNRVITNQLKNIIRNNYTNYTRPCLRCAAAEDSSSCRIYVTQCGDCPLYAYWEKRKQSAYNLKMPLALENHQQEAHSVVEDFIDYDIKIEKLTLKLKGVLKPNEMLVYECLFIKNEDESLIAKKLGFKTNEQKRSPGYKQIQNIKKNIISKVRKLIRKGELDL
jgi:hypothetical protein